MQMDATTTIIIIIIGSALTVVVQHTQSRCTGTIIHILKILSAISVAKRGTKQFIAGPKLEKNTTTQSQISA